MPATEQTWRNPKLMHLVFGISGLALLGATIWMFAADHDREWKDYQRTFQNVEAWTTQARLDAQTTGEYEQKRGELVDAVNAAAAAAPAAELVDDFQQRIETNEKGDTSDIESLQSQVTAEPTEANRNALLDEMQQFVTDARFEEDDLSRRLKFRRADLDVARSDKDLAVGEGKSASEVASLQGEVNRVQEEVDALTLELQDASTYRKELESILIDIRREESQARKALADHDATVTQLTETRQKQSRTSKKLLEMPILDAFNSPLKVNQIWLPKLTLNNNFRDVARFDRCTTCHLGIEATAPGSAVEPGYKGSQQLTLQLATPKEPPTGAKQKDGTSVAPTLREVYGLELAEEGLLDPEDVTVEVVEPRTAAANAQLIPGDVIETIGGVKILSRERALDYLLTSVKWGQPLALGIRRGLPHPYSSHPRLDLYVGSLSPHKANDVGCTICHEGQGSATSFKWASHTPNSPAEAEQWARKYGWFDNHHWIFPMRPERFLESSCLKCHHEVTELNPSERYPEPPAPKLVKGYNLVRQYGCFGCHEINGYDGPDKRIGPDLRAEPNYAFAAQHLLADEGLEPREKTLAEQVIEDPTNATARRQLVQLIEADARLAGESDSEARLSADSRSLAAVLADVESPGEYRKVGPSLRYLASKVNYDFLYDWIRNPRDFRPTTKMPRFFGLHDHLVPEAKLDDRGNPVMEDGHVVKEESDGKKEAEKFEPIEIRAITEYLLASSQSFEYLGRPEGVTEGPSPERGKELFQLRGCLACHQHGDFPEAKQTQGPDLSRMGSKLTTAEGQKWLYSWVREPNRYHARTVMPNVFLNPIEEKDQEGNVSSVTDPAADITAYLLESQGWEPKDVPDRENLSEQETEALAELAMSHLSQAFTRKRAEQYLQDGIPEAERANLKGDEVLLVGELNDENRRDRVLQYVGRRTISKYGCSGCHDIPGFENAKPIGTALADWGRKDPAKLAFEQIGQYIAEAHGNSQHGDAAHGDHGHGPDPRDMPPDEGYMMEKLQHHQREGFLWQKLREPRSYDYKKTENKSYNERLRMPQFPFKQDEIEAVMTFVLGLVAEPPAAQYVYNPDPRQKAIVEGKHLLDKFNCAGCHTLETEKYRFEYDPNHPLFAEERTFPEGREYDLFRPDFTPKQIQDSMQLDARGRGHAEITASVVTNEQGEVQEQEDDENPDLMLNFFTLWNTELINGQPWLAAEQVPIPIQWISGKREPVGGDLARLLHPVVLEAQRKVNPNAKASDAWGWVPPPLVGEGQKVQTDWLHDFLLDPYAIRPATVLRMPKFNMSSEEASKLANYFAAVDGVDYPYDFESRTRESHLAQKEEQFPERLEDALTIVTNGNFCVKCHKVGDFAPQGSDRDMAPQLGQIYRRLRPEFLEAWLANPKRLLPYTGMPVNFPVDKPLDPEVIKVDKGELITEGKSPDHLEAVVDLLLNYDEFTKNHFSVKPLVQAAPMPGAEGQPTSSSE